MGVLNQAQGGPMAPQLAQAASQAGAPPPAAPAPTQPQDAAPPPPAPGQAPPQQAPAAAAPDQAAPQQGAPGAGDEPATPEEQRDYDRSMQAVAKVLYGNDKIANSVVDQIDPNDKIGSTAKVSMLFIRELDRKLNMSETTIAPVTQEVVERVAELAEARHSISYSPGDMEKVLGAAWEGVAAMFGSDGGQEGSQAFQQFVSQFDDRTLSEIRSTYEAALNG